MTDKEKKQIDKFDDLTLLYELAVTFSNTPDAHLGSYHRTNLMKIFENLNLEHFKYLP